MTGGKGTWQVNGNSTRRVRVEAGGEGVVAHVGLHALGALADRLGLGDALSARIPPTGERLPLHDRGKVLVQAMLMLAGGGEACSDIEALRAQERLFGAVPSDSTLYRSVRQISPATLGDLWEAMAEVRAEVWHRSSVTNNDRPVILDIDATVPGGHGADMDRHRLAGGCVRSSQLLLGWSSIGSPTRCRSWLGSVVVARVRQVTAPGLGLRVRPRHVHDSEPTGVRHATWLELFFDLAFVVAVARLAVLLHDDHDLGGFVSFAGLFVTIWWAWISYSHFADLFDEDRPLDRLAQLSAMLGATVAAVALSDGVTADSAVLAAVFAAMFSLLAGLYAHAWRTEPAARELCRWLVAGSTVGATCWLASLAVPAPGRFWLWAVAVVANAAISGPIAHARTSAPPHQVSHMPERFGLFAIVVLGESILAVVNGIHQADWETAGVVTAVSGFMVAASIWWVYFADFDEAVIDQAIAGGRAAQLRAFLYAYGHLLVYVAIAGAGVGVELAIEASVTGAGPALLLPGALALLVVGFIVVGAGRGHLGSPIHLAAKLGAVAAGLLAAVLVDDAAVATPILALGWAGLAAHKSMYSK